MDFGTMLLTASTDFTWYAAQEIWFASGGDTANYNAVLRVWISVQTGNLLPAWDSNQGTVPGVRRGGGGASAIDATVDQLMWLEALWSGNTTNGWFRTYGSLLEVVSQWPNSPRLGGEAEAPVFTNPGQPAPPPQPVQRTVTYRPYMVAAYQGNGNRRAVNGGMWQGAASGNPGGNGNQWGMAMFDYNAIRRDLSGATINRIQFTIRINHSWYAAGGDARLGWFNRTDFPTSGVGTPGNAAAIGTFAFTRGQTRTIDVTNALRGVVAGSGFTGVSLGPATALSNLQQYVVADGNTNTPTLAITFTK
jgi:hypothetical protein